MYVLDRDRWFIVAKRHSGEWLLEPGMQGNLISSSDFTCSNKYIADTILKKPEINHWRWWNCSVYGYLFKSGYFICFLNEARFFIYARLQKMSIFSLFGMEMILQLLNKRSEYCQFLVVYNYAFKILICFRLPYSVKAGSLFILVHALMF